MQPYQRVRPSQVRKCSACVEQKPPVLPAAQDSQRKRLSSALGEDVLCAAINNNGSAYTASIEFQEHMEEVLQPQLQVPPFSAD